MSSPWVTAEVGAIPGYWPDGSFDLIVLGEVLYYLDDAELVRVVERTLDSLDPDGHLLAIHYRPTVPEHARTGDGTHAALRAAPQLRRVLEHVEEQFLLDVFQLT